MFISNSLLWMIVFFAAVVATVAAAVAAVVVAIFLAVSSDEILQTLANPFQRDDCPLHTTYT